MRNLPAPVIPSTRGRRLRIGNLLCHLGLLALIGGHFVGILMPKSVTNAARVPEWAYHDGSVTMGTISGTAMVLGFGLLMFRRGTDARGRSVTSRTDVLTFAVLAAVMIMGMAETVGINLFGGGYDYRVTIAPWFRGLFALQPDPALMVSAPLVYRVHIALAFLLLALWPFTRLVHAWSVPVAYLRRSPIIYRSRTTQSRLARDVEMREI